MKKITFALFTVLILLSCKKDAVVNNGAPVNDIHLSNDTLYYGFLTFSKVIILPEPPSQSITMYYDAGAEFTYTAQSGNSILANKPVGSVAIDSIALTYQANTVNYFNDSISDSQSNWQVVGQNVIPSFTYTSNRIKAQYTNYNLLPDTINRSQGLTVHFTISNVDKINIYISDGLAQMGYIVPTGATSFTLSAAALAALNGGNGNLQIMTTNYDVESVYGKTMRFEYVQHINKPIYIK
jgi:hypothetical protein